MKVLLGGHRPDVIGLGGDFHIYITNDGNKNFSQILLSSGEMEFGQSTLKTKFCLDLFVMFHMF